MTMMPVEASRSRYARLISLENHPRARAVFDVMPQRLEWPSPLLKQAAVLALFVAAVLLSSLVPGLGVTNADGLAVGFVLMAISTLLAVACTVSWDISRLKMIIPALDCVAIGFLVASTGGGQSIFGAIVILPVVWFAVQDGRWFILYSGLGAFVALVIPMLGRGASVDASAVVEGLFAPVAYLIVAVVLNELARRLRLQSARSKRREEEAEAELFRAAAVQRALLPTEEDLLADYRLAGACVPTRSVGGDFFDWYPVTGGIAVTMGDVMGKGVGAGMIAAISRAVLRSAAHAPDPAVAFNRMAACLETELKDAVSFLTLFHARLDEATGVLTYADAGHGLTVLVRADGTFEPLESTDLPIGIVSDFTWSTRQVSIDPGDTLVTFSDGVLDLYDGSLIAMERVAAIVHSAPSAREAVDALLAVAILQHNPDDVTVLMLRRDAETADQDDEHQGRPEGVEGLMIIASHGTGRHNR